MPRCSVCTHPNRDEVERQIIRGDSERAIANRFGLSKSAIHRHKHQHLTERLARASEVTLARNVREADALLNHLAELKRKLTSYSDVLEKLLHELQEIAEDPSLLFKEKAKGGLAFVGGPLLKTLAELRKFVDSHGRFLDLEARLRKLLAEEDTSQTRDILTNPAFLEVRGAIVHALAPFSEARSAVYEALRELAGKQR